MPTYSRRQEILAYIKEHRRATVAELATNLYCSEATIRRDLSSLEFQRFVKRVHGAAVIVEDSEVTSTTFRETRNVEEKEEVAKLTLSKIPPFRTLFIDNSSTALTLVKHMDLSNKEVFTNSLSALAYLGKSEKITLNIPGGQARYDMNEITGPKVIEDMKNIRVDVAIVSCGSFCEDGTYEASPVTALIKRCVLVNARYSICIFDKSKLSKSSTYKVVRPEDFDLIVTDAHSEDMKVFFDKGCNIVCK